jgi:hypothetical protein
MASGASLINDEKARRALIKDLAGAVSRQSRVTNNTWIALTTVALFAIVPHTPSGEGNLTLPFNLGEVAQTWFYGLVFSILVVLAIAFAAAHTQQVRTQKLAQRNIDSMLERGASTDLLHPREYFDMWRMPSLIRVAPLPQALRGRYQFYADSAGLPTWLRLATVTYYGLLKLVSWVVYFLFPMWALWHARANVSFSVAARWYAVIGTCVAGFALLEVLWFDVEYSLAIFRHLWQIKTLKIGLPRMAAKIPSRVSTKQHK